MKSNQDKLKTTRRITVSVIGGHDIDTKVAHLAQKIGYIIGQQGAVLVCGGLEGVMREAAKGAKKAGGLTIGLLPGNDKKAANPYIDIPLPTTIGYARNAMVACSADIIVALPGSHGTSCEISYGFVYKRPIFDLGGWKKPGMVKVRNLKDFESKLKKHIAQIKTERRVTD